MYRQHLDYLPFLTAERILFAELLLDQYLILFVCSNQLPLIYDDF